MNRERKPVLGVQIEGMTLASGAAVARNVSCT